MTNHEEELEERIEELEDEVEQWKDRYDDALEEIDELESQLEDVYLDPSNTIFDLTNFKRQLEIQNLMTKELDEFIENYMRFSNQGD